MANQSGKEGSNDIILAVVRSIRRFNGPKLKLELKLNRITLEKAGFSMRKKNNDFHNESSCQVKFKPRTQLYSAFSIFSQMSSAQKILSGHLSQYVLLWKWANAKWEKQVASWFKSKSEENIPDVCRSHVQDRVDTDNLHHIY